MAKKRKQLGKGMRYNSNGSIEGYGTIHNKRGDTIKYSFTRSTVDEITDIQARIRILGTVSNDIIKIRVNKYTNEVELIRKGRTQTDGIIQLSKDITVSEYIDYFLFEHRRRGVNGKIVEDTTFAGYVERCSYIKRNIGEIIVSELTRKDLEYCVDTLQKGGLVDSTCRQIRDLLVSMVHFARKDGLLEEDIMQGEKLTLKEKKGKAKKYVIEGEDIAKCITYCLDNKEYGVLMLLYTGIRASELAGITWEDIDFEKCTVDINKGYKRVKNVKWVDGKEEKSYHAEFRNLKTKSSYRTIGISKEYVELLKQHKEAQKKLAKKNNKEFKETDWVFTTKTYNAYLSDYISDKIRKIMNTIKIKNYDKITAHSLRHTYCSEAIKNNVDIKQVQMILGHSNVGVTLDWYTHINTETIINTSCKVAEKMEGIKVKE